MHRIPRLVTAVVLSAAMAVVGWSSRPAGATPCATPAAGHVAVVIDFGTLPDAPQGVFTSCVEVGSKATGMDALRAATSGAVVVDTSGKVCGLLGYPPAPSAVNCSAPHDGRIRYWAYFLGTESGWTYSSRGAAAPVSPAVVQGWRYLDVPASGGAAGIVPPRDVAGRGPSWRWESTCPVVSVPAPTTAGSSSTATTIVSGSPPLTSAASSSTVGASGSTSTTSSRPSGAGPSASRPAGAITGLKSDGTVPGLSGAQVRAHQAQQSSSAGRTGYLVWVGLGIVVIGGAMLALVVRSRRRLDQD